MLSSLEKGIKSCYCHFAFAFCIRLKVPNATGNYRIRRGENSVIAWGKFFLSLLTECHKCFPLTRACCPEPMAQAQGRPVGGWLCSKMWSLQGSQSWTAAGDNRPHWSTLTPSPPTLCSSSRPPSKGTTGSVHTGMSMYLFYIYIYTFMFTFLF